MPVVFDNVIGSVVDDIPQTSETNPSPSPPPPINLSSQLRKLDQRTRRLKAD